VAVAIATVGGVGRAPLAPGTVASALTIAVLWWFGPPPMVLAALVVVVAALGTWAAGEAERALGGKDPGAIVVDEVAGMTLSVLAVPLTISAALVAFLLFRVFDVLKPFPAGASQRLSGGIGVMTDDLIAGLYALALVALAGRLGWL
jgi:phosphatidylglycerophosphatase A